MVKNKVDTQEKNSMGAITHILGLFFNIPGPLIVLLASGNKEVKKHAKAILNWQISVFIYAIVTTSILLLILPSIPQNIFTSIIGVIGILFLFLLIILSIIFPIIAAIRATEGKFFIYPLALPFFNL